MFKKAVSEQKIWVSLERYLMKGVKMYGSLPTNNCKWIKPYKKVPSFPCNKLVKKNIYKYSLLKLIEILTWCHLKNNWTVEWQCPTSTQFVTQTCGHICIHMIAYRRKHFNKWFIFHLSVYDILSVWMQFSS